MSSVSFSPPSQPHNDPTPTMKDPTVLSPPPSFFPALSLRQKLYILLMHSIGAGLLDAGINFALAYAMYHGKTAYLWDLPNTIAGDAAMTVIIQGVLTWIIDGTLTHQDCRKGVVKPIVLSDTAKRPTTHVVGFVSWMARASLDLLEPGLSAKTRLMRLASAALRGAVFAALCLPFAWGIGIGIACATWPGLAGNTPLTGWAPMIFKAVFTFFLGMLVTPVTTVLAMTQHRSVPTSTDLESFSERASDVTATNGSGPALIGKSEKAEHKAS
ncbi:hypothetical protein DFJ77DRAFT_475530 [Powellomyces hirtus]|nr:hypothetical protein DFJ77DRAFT_475530 [Powellomyces hirtus]